MGRGEQDEPAGKSGITSDQRTGSAVSCGPFPISWCGRNTRYPKCLQTCTIFCILFGWRLPVHCRHWFPDMLCDSGR